MTLRSRFTLSLLTIVVALLVPLALALRTAHDVRTELRGLRQSEFSTSILLGQVREELAEFRLSETGLFALKTPDALDRMRKSLDKLRTLTARLDQADSIDQVMQLRGSLRRTAQALEREYALAAAGDWATADSLSLAVIGPAVSRAIEHARTAERQLQQSTTERVEVAQTRMEQLIAGSAGALGLALLFSAFIAWRLTRAVRQPVAELERGMAAVADGDFAQRLELETSRKDEFGRLATSFQEMARQLAELDKLKAEFVSIASHELKTPINVIIGYLELLAEGVYGPVTPQQAEIVRVVQTQGHTLARLARQLLDVSRFEAGGGRIDPRPVGLPELVDDLEKAFAILGVQRGVRFVVTRAEGLPNDVLWDADRMNEVVGNLLSNAFKFTPRGGEVELRVEPLPDAIAIEVRDTGAGIPPEQLPRVFEKFYQADNQRQSSVTGTGLGLAIAKSIVEAHGGTIRVESTRGVGTTFTITMPRTVSAGRRTPLRESAPPMETVS